MFTRSSDPRTTTGDGQWRRLAGHSRFLPHGISAALFAILVVFVVDNEASLRTSATILHDARPAWLLVALALQLVTYLSVAEGWRMVLASDGKPPPLRRLLPVALAKLFIDQMVPSAGLSGNLMLVDRLSAMGAPKSSATAAVLLSIIGYYFAYAVLVVLTLLLLWLHGQATPLLAGLTTAFLLVALAIPSLALWLYRHGSAPSHKRLESIRPIAAILHAVEGAPAGLIERPRLLVGISLCNAAVFFADAASLQVCLFALGQHPPAETAFIALIIASVVVTLGPLPLGLGGFEATCTAMLKMLGVSLAAAFSATLLLRLFTLWLPLIPGALLARRAIAHVGRASPR